MNWTHAEIATVRRLAGTVSVAAIAAAVGRTERAVCALAYRRDISLVRYGEHSAAAKYTDVDVEAVRQLYDAGMRTGEIARRFPHINRRSIDRWVAYTLRLGPPVETGA